jgi:hypothetical protein
MRELFRSLLYYLDSYKMTDKEGKGRGGDKTTLSLKKVFGLTAVVLKVQKLFKGLKTQLCALLINTTTT